MVCGGCSQYRLRLGQILTRRAETWEGRRHGNLGCFVRFSAMVNRAKMASYFHYRDSILLLNCPQDKTQTQLTRKPEHLNNTPQRGLTTWRTQHHTPSANNQTVCIQRRRRRGKWGQIETRKGKKLNEPRGDMSSTCRYAPSWLQIGAFARAVWYLLISSV